MKQSPDIDCVFLNAGLAGTSNFSKPETVDLERFNYEMKINFTAQVVLVHAFTPFLLAKDSPSSFIL
jgi:short-subunit dehydrogenase involved in D-alanine esterification of teichoic acids